MRTHSVFIVLAGLALIGLSGCSTARDQLGLDRSAPDEFMVVKNAPLSMPPDYSLRPPRPGAPRPQDVAAYEAARTTVFGDENNAQNTSVSASSAENVLLQKAGGTQANPNIRNIVDVESQEIDKDNQPVVDKLLGWGRKEEPGASVVNAKEEAERLKRNAAEGRPVTEGDTPSIDP